MKRRVPPTPARRPSLQCPVFVAYSHVAIARDALGRLRHGLLQTQNAVTIQPMLWRFDQLNGEGWREIALQDATRAQLFILALGEGGTLTAEVESWLNQLTAQRDGAPISANLYLGGDEFWTISLQQSRTTGATALAAKKPVAESRASVTLAPTVEPSQMMDAGAAIAAA